ncbi:trypsin-like serine protease [Hyalangium gracile]|uniref:trypsin-like serine protease n=1 Tax=Hyalangium gracile TaxID=394092 RepID=UPI001CCDAC0C|nr:trypsin-like serine protease [Hyalangium gracile]
MLPGDGLGDSTNRYSSTVMVNASTAAGKSKCNGVILAPRLVLTAGHCVCRSRDCAENATVTTVTYPPARGSLDLVMGARYEERRGTVRPHPSLELRHGDNAASSSTRADLALIFLNQPLGSTFPAVPLANAEARAGESITLVGYGRQDASDRVLGVRRFGVKKITSVREGGGFLEPHGLIALNSGSGEPCLRQEGAQEVLVGIANSHSGDKPTFTSVYPHREWLLSEIHRATHVGAEESSP